MSWVGLGRVTDFLARLFPPQGPPVLILSLPRSGSSWVGEILGHAVNALYLREPITQSNMQQRHADGAVISMETADEYLQAFSDNAFAGIPDFFPDVITDTKQWSLLGRKKRRVVIKEVNPLASKWLMSTYKPKIIFVIRHPAAIASSFNRLGWTDINLSHINKSLHNINKKMVDFENRDFNKNDFWEMFGVMCGVCYCYMLNIIDEYPNSMVFSYEELCSDSVSIFQEIFKFSELIWDDNIELLIKSKSSVNDDTNPYSTDRYTSQMPDRWRKTLSRENLDRLHKSYLRFELPWYVSDSEW